MKSRHFFPVALGAVIPCLAFAQQPAPVVPAVVPPAPVSAPAAPAAKSAAADAIAKAEQGFGDLRTGLVKQRDALKLAIDKAAKLGQIRVSTTTTHRGLLERFQPSEGTLGDLARVMIPPQVEGADALNTAWSDLRQAAVEAAARGQGITDGLLALAVEELQKAARSAEVPEALDDADKLIEAWIKFAEFNRVSNLGPSTGAYTKESLQRLAAFERAVLTAFRDRDAAALGTAFSRASSLQNNGRTIANVRVDEFVEELRARSVEPFAKAATESQRALEQAVMQNPGVDKLEEAFAHFQAKGQALERLREQTLRNFSGSSNRDTVTSAYRTAVAMLEYVKSGTEEDSAPSMITLPEVGVFPASPEFRKFYTKLSNQLMERRRQISDMAEKRREAAAKEAQAKAAAEARAVVEQAKKSVIEKIKAVKTPEDVLALANDLPMIRVSEERINWSALQNDLQMIAAIWTGAGSHAVGGEYDRSMVYGTTANHPFGLEVRALRERAVRESTAKRLNLPQLKQAPLDTMPVMEALEQLARKAAEKEEWKQSYALLQNMPPTPANAERLQAIRSFLVAQNFEAGGQWHQAAESYLAVLRTVGDFTPVKQAGERLKKLQSEHPELVGEKKTEAPKVIESKREEPKSPAPQPAEPEAQQ